MGSQQSSGVSTNIRHALLKLTLRLGLSASTIQIAGRCPAPPESHRQAWNKNKKSGAPCATHGYFSTVFDSTQLLHMKHQPLNLSGVETKSNHQ